MTVLLSEMARSLRGLVRTPGATLIAVVTLGLALGAQGLVLTVIDGVLLRPLPYPDPERLVMVWNTNPASGVEQLSISAPDFLDLREDSTSFAALAAIRRSAFVVGAGEPEQVNGALVTLDFFDVIRLPPQPSELPLSGSTRTSSFSIEGAPPPRNGEGPTADAPCC